MHLWLIVTLISIAIILICYGLDKYWGYPKIGGDNKKDDLYNYRSTVCWTCDPRQDTGKRDIRITDNR
jgi:hypothetical protein